MFRASFLSFDPRHHASITRNTSHLMVHQEKQNKQSAAKGATTTKPQPSTPTHPTCPPSQGPTALLASLLGDF